LACVVVEPFARECEPVERQCGCALTADRGGERSRCVERERVDAKARRLVRQLGIAFEIGRRRADGWRVDCLSALLCVALLLNLLILFGTGACGGRCVGWSGRLLCVARER
jgi:hypothetical protein